ncbi:hypothetical protein [Paenibacillus popilliae]|uniref:Na+/H+ and K+/H+ antiporter n=1 Tax=Paenibacillus popilliae ATCC 14706 TaxID=1212764 RepID=M9LCY6_PAEPP|nr:hypothetical protein [Paenibacillus popilliae]GAC44102.1 Na+/H+ and K+/H+ antiporter [Paenibacillus popilliae ATCC 14706]
MFAYLKGAGASAFVATLLCSFAILNKSDSSNTSTLRTYAISLLVVVLFSYLGCVLGWFLLKFITKHASRDTLLEIISFFSLGFIFALLLGAILRLDRDTLDLTTILGSITFYLAQKIHSIVISWIMVLIGPISAYIAFYYFSYL